jgi:hypothetical protein
MRIRLVLSVALLLASGLTVASARPARAADQCFPQTGKCVPDRFYAYWQQHGGLALNGYPLSDPFTEVLEDAKQYTVQYFERARLELHPENAPPYDVLLGQFGRVMYPVNPRFPELRAAVPLPGAVYFDASRHNLAGQFLAYWRANGGLDQFGYPLSEELRERLEDGNVYTVQYFERARFEHHPENPPPYAILLGQFGRRILEARALPARPPGPYPVHYALGYGGATGPRAVLGAPTGPPTETPGALQRFERGRMLWRADTRTIYALANDAGSGEAPGSWWAFADTWAEGQPAGGEPAPGGGGLYAPQRGFFKVWSEQPEVRRLLGYARTPNVEGGTLGAQEFVGGVGLVATYPGGPRGTLYVAHVLANNGRFESYLTW